MFAELSGRTGGIGTDLNSVTDGVNAPCALGDRRGAPMLTANTVCRLPEQAVNRKDGPRLDNLSALGDAMTGACLKHSVGLPRAAEDGLLLRLHERCSSDPWAL